MCHDRGYHFVPFLHKNRCLKNKTWLGSHILFYMDMYPMETNSRIKIYFKNVLFLKIFTFCIASVYISDGQRVAMKM